MQFFAEGLPRYGIDGILANEGFRAYARMVDALRHNRILFAMMDQGVKKAETGVPMRFLGKDMPMPGGVMQLARQTRAPIVPVVALAVRSSLAFRHRARTAFPAGRYAGRGHGCRARRSRAPDPCASGTVELAAATLA